MNIFLFLETPSSVLANPDNLRFKTQYYQAQQREKKIFVEFK